MRTDNLNFECERWAKLLLTLDNFPSMMLSNTAVYKYGSTPMRASLAGEVHAPQLHSSLMQKRFYDTKVAHVPLRCRFNMSHGLHIAHVLLQNLARKDG